MALKKESLTSNPDTQEVRVARISGREAAAPFV
jgi:hypothetical protein